MVNYNERKIRIETPKALILQRAESDLFYHFCKKNIYIFHATGTSCIDCYKNKFHFVEIVFKKRKYIRIRYDRE